MNSDRTHRKRAMALLAVLLVVLAGGAGFALRQTYALDLAGVELPPENVEAFARAETYARASEWAGLCNRLTSFPVVGLALLTGWAIALERRFGGTAWRWPMRMAFLLGYALWADLMALPHLILGFGHQKAFGLTPLNGLEMTKLILLSMPVPLAIFFSKRLLIFCCMPIFGRRWWVAAPLVLFTVFSVVPELLSRTRPIDPVETLTALDDAELEASLDQVAAKVGMDLDYYVVDHSERYHTVNMYVTGRLGREYVVMTDTIVSLLTHRELGVVLAHEALHQHWRFRTLMVSKVYGLATMLLIFWIVHCYEGRKAIVPHRRLQVLLILLLVTSVVRFALAPLNFWKSRAEERAADRYALEITGDGDALHSAILKVSAANLIPYDKPGWAYVLGATHPTTRARLAMARSGMAP